MTVSIFPTVSLPVVILLSATGREEPICLCVPARRQVGKVYADKGYSGKPNRQFLAMNKIDDGIMRKDTRSTKLTAYEKERNKQIAKKRYIVEQYFGLSHLHDGAFRARFTRIIKNLIEVMCRQMAFNITRGVKILSTA